MARETEHLREPKQPRREAWVLRIENLLVNSQRSPEQRLRPLKRSLIEVDGCEGGDRR